MWLKVKTAEASLTGMGKTGENGSCQQEKAGEKQKHLKKIFSLKGELTASAGGGNSEKWTDNPGKKIKG